MYDYTMIIIHKHNTLQYMNTLHTHTHAHSTLCQQTHLSHRLQDVVALNREALKMHTNIIISNKLKVDKLEYHKHATHKSLKQGDSINTNDNCSVRPN